MSNVNTLPPGIFAAADYIDLARQALEEPVWHYLACGSGREITVRRNRGAFRNDAILPRLLRDVSAGHTRCELAGETLAHPVLLAPVAHQSLFHGDAEFATAQASAATDTRMIVSTLASRRLEEIRPHCALSPWFQLYFQPRREDTLDLAARAEAAGYGALVVTLDSTIQSPGLNALRAGFDTRRDTDPVNLSTYPGPQPTQLRRDQSRIFQGLMQHAPGPDDLRLLLAETRLPVWVKGVLRVDDALMLRDLGVAGLVISNHGGRALDGAPASLDVLPQIRAAVGDDYPLILDGGIRHGGDVFIAMAKGANAVAVGRLQACALAVAGPLGVAHMVRLLREELELTMAQSGCASLAEITADLLQKRPE
ncbi:alpha-hydroxy acid oxidase [Granulosicoccaceae sp. 1_MG-2023]|nr:alpha-hydroxy acid oxidase [Granulosicoccaceae sp. 1_MG-2023]